MPYVTVGQENSGSIDHYYEDHGSGPTVVLIHGYPLSGRSWDKQVPVLLEAGCRVIAYDRRGMGRSSQPTCGYGYDTFAADLDAVMQALDLNEATIVGHSMGTGEVTRYLGTYGSARVSSGVLVSPIPPFLLQTDDNPDGLPQSIFDNFTEAAKADMPAWMTTFLNNFFSTGSKRDTGVSDQAFQANWNLAITASGTAAVDCIGTWLTDFREDLPRIDVPLMVIQGDADQVLPFEKTGKRVGEFADDVDLVVIPGASHAIPWTHAQEVNDALLRFLSVNAEALAG
jgi:non-heme chloroperoxidase